MNQSFKEQLLQWKQLHIHQEVKVEREKKHIQKSQKNHYKHLTESEIKSLMGINKATYRRAKGGAFRQR